MTVSTMMKTNERVSKTGNRFIGDHRGVRSEAKYRFVPSLIESQREHVGKNRPASSLERGTILCDRSMSSVVQENTPGA